MRPKQREDSAVVDPLGNEAGAVLSNVTAAIVRMNSAQSAGTRHVAAKSCGIGLVPTLTPANTLVAQPSASAGITDSSVPAGRPAVELCGEF